MLAGGRDGSATWRDLGIDGPAQPSLAFTMRTEVLSDAHGFGRGDEFEADFPEGYGTHGGLHPLELAKRLVARISGQDAGTIDDTPISLRDVAPAICHWLGITAGDMAGRALRGAHWGASMPQRATLNPWRASAGHVLGATRAGEIAVLDGLRELCRRRSLQHNHRPTKKAPVGSRGLYSSGPMVGDVGPEPTTS